MAGGVLLILALVGGGWVSRHAGPAAAFTFTGTALTASIVGYGFFASVLPVWMLLLPRDYLSTFLKIATILGLAVAILILLPPLRMPAVTPFAKLGEGPVFAGKFFPFVFITIACGAISGFHALVASGTTPKMLRRETDARLIGYGGMLMESFVGVMAMIAACTLHPGVYFAMNSPAPAIGTPLLAGRVGAVQSAWGFVVPRRLDLAALAALVGEKHRYGRDGRGGRRHWPSG